MKTFSKNENLRTCYTESTSDVTQRSSPARDFLGKAQAGGVESPEKIGAEKQRWSNLISIEWSDSDD
jgi:hypothetical protein